MLLLVPYVLGLLFMGLLSLELLLVKILVVSLVAQPLEIYQASIQQTSFNQTSIIQQLQTIDQTSIIQQLQTIDQTSIQILVLVMPPVFGNQLMDVLAFLLQISLVRQQVEILVFLLLQLRVLDLLWQT